MNTPACARVSIGCADTAGGGKEALAVVGELAEEAGADMAAFPALKGDEPGADMAAFPALMGEEASGDGTGDPTGKDAVGDEADTAAFGSCWAGVAD